MNGTGTNIQPGLLGVYHIYANDPEGNRVYLKNSEISVEHLQQGLNNNLPKGFYKQGFHSQFISRDLVSGAWQVCYSLEYL